MLTQLRPNFVGARSLLFAQLIADSMPPGNAKQQAIVRRLIVYCDVSQKMMTDRLKVSEQEDAIAYSPQVFDVPCVLLLAAMPIRILFETHLLEVLNAAVDRNDQPAANELHSLVGDCSTIIRKLQINSGVCSVHRSAPLGPAGVDGG